MQNFIVPDKAAAIPNLPLLRIFIATLKPPPSSEQTKNNENKLGTVQHSWDIPVKI